MFNHRPVMARCHNGQELYGVLMPALGQFQIAAMTAVGTKADHTCYQASKHRLCGTLAFNTGLGTGARGPTTQARVTNVSVVARAVTRHGIPDHRG